MITLHVVKWAAQECEWQQSGEKSVGWMVEGWEFAATRCGLYPHPGDPPVAITLEDVLTLGALVEPRHNARGLRKVGVRVGSDIKLDWQLVPSALDQLLTQQDIGPSEWFREYEDIHPFRDGNGRTGNILFNWLNRTLPEPVMPPNLWHDPRRGDFYG